jgi:hypothetical protein
MARQLVPSFYYSDLAKALTTPYTDFEAYKAGVIDKNGKLQKPEGSINPFEYFVLKLKRIFEELPMGVTKSYLSSYIPAMQYFTEELKEFGFPEDETQLFLEGLVAEHSDGDLSYLELIEEMGSANLGGPSASPTQNTGGVSGFDPPMQKGVERRKSILGFENSCDMYDVCPETFVAFRNSGSLADLPKDFPAKSTIYRGVKRRGATRFAVRNSETGEIYFPVFEETNKMKKYIVDTFLELLENDAVHDFQDTKPGEIAVEPKQKKLTHSEEFKKNIGELMQLHKKAIASEKPAHAAEYAARMVFHAADYHALKDTPHIESYMDAIRDQIKSSSSGNETEKKPADLIRGEILDSKFVKKPLEFKTNRGTVTSVFPTKFIQDLIQKMPDKLSAWTSTTPGSTQNLVYPKKQKSASQERQRQMREVLSSLPDAEELEKIKKSTEEKALKDMVLQHPTTGRFHFVKNKPEDITAKIGFRSGEGPENLKAEHARHLTTYRVNVKGPPKDSSVFTLDPEAQKTLLQSFDPEHHEYLKSLTDIHL